MLLHARAQFRGASVRQYITPDGFRFDICDDDYTILRSRDMHLSIQQSITNI